MRYFQYCRKSTEDDDHQVASLDSQQTENERRFATEADVEIVDTYREAKSAKIPGRPLFGAMLDRIERGEADGILAWHPDRLARNSVDGGRLIYLLDTGKLKDLKFCTYTFENTSQGKFMLQIVFANSKYYVDSLSENVRRGIRTKVESGWRPNQPPIGYLNSSDTTPIVSDPDRFALVRRMWDLALTGTYTLRQIRDIVAAAGLRTVQRRRRGGNILTISAMYGIFKNPFYTGMLRLNGRIYQGKHKPMVTASEFALVQKHIGRQAAPQPKRKTWAYTGMIRCGSCGLAVTAEEKVNRFGSRYTYYHCTKRRGSAICREPYIRLQALEASIERFLSEITISDEIHAWLLAKVERETAGARETAVVERKALAKALAQTETALQNLRQLRIRDQITDAEFSADRESLERERFQLSHKLNGPEIADPFEPEKLFLSFSNGALKWFREGDDDIRRLIFETVGSNPVLQAKELKIGAAFPFRRLQRIAEITELCTVLKDIRTRPSADLDRFLNLARELLRRVTRSEIRAASPQCHRSTPMS